MLKECFDVVGIKRTAKEMLILGLQSLAVNLVVPTAGASAAILFADDAQKRGESRTKAVNGVLLTYLVDYTSISFLLFIALVFLYFIKSLTPTEYIPAALFFLLTAGVYALAIAAAKKASLLDRILMPLAKMFIAPLLKLFKKKINIEKNVRYFISELSDASRAAFRDKKNVIHAMGWSLFAHFIRLCVLYVIFLSFGVDPAYRVILAGYAVGSLFVVVSPTPQGIGFVEGSMTIVFTGLGLPSAVAATTTIIYRAFDFWIPFAAGFFLLQGSNIKRIKGELFENRQ